MSQSIDDPLSALQPTMSLKCCQAREQFGRSPRLRTRAGGSLAVSRLRLAAFSPKGRRAVNWAPVNSSLLLQSTRPFFCSQLVPWAFPPLTNLRVDKFTWRPNKCSPIITKLNFMVSFSPCNENYYIQIVAVCVHLTCGHWVPF